MKYKIIHIEWEGPFVLVRKIIVNCNLCSNEINQLLKISRLAYRENYIRVNVMKQILTKRETEEIIKTNDRVEQLIDIDDLCRILKLKRSYIYLLTHGRKIPHYKLNGFLH